MLRYHIVGEVPWKDFPLYIFNKGLALGGIVLLSFNFTLGPARQLGIPIPQAWLDTRKVLGMTGFLVILVHVLMSFLLFSPAKYQKFFRNRWHVKGPCGHQYAGRGF